MKNKDVFFTTSKYQNLSDEEIIKQINIKMQNILKY